MKIAQTANLAERASLPAIYVNGISTMGPGFADWPALAAILRGDASWLNTATQAPAPQALPAAERRRVGMSIRLALATGFAATQHAQMSPAHLRTVFSSSSGDGEICHVLCEALASEDRLISPTRFHNSVLNAASGYWSIATGCMTASTSLCGHDASFAAGLLESAVQIASTGEDCLLLAYDTPYPEPLQSCRPLLDAMGIALALSPQRGKSSIAALQISLEDAALTASPIDVLSALQNGIPAARGLPLLSAIARQTAARANLQYLDQLALCVEVQPCPAHPNS